MNDMTPEVPAEAATAAQATQMLPLAALYLHPMNTRSEPPPFEIEALAESIAVCGLMQNLLGFDDPDQPGRIGIVAGGRRLRALQLLAERGGPDTIPVNVTTMPLQAQAWAMAENAARAPLHPADEIIAYGKMRDAGAMPVTIARAFAVTERHVKGRLKLADLPGPVMVALKSGGINLTEAEAFTVSDDAERILDVLNRIGSSSYTDARWIRSQLVPSQIGLTDRRVRFVTIDLYEASGGKTTRDLFSDNVWLHDEALLNDLFARRFAEEVEAVKAEGWGFVWDAKGENHWNDTRMEKVVRVDRPEVALPEGDMARLEELSEQDELTDEEEQERIDLESRQIGDFDEDQKAQLGAFVSVTHKGEIDVYRGLQVITPKAGKDDGDGPSGTAPAEKVSDAMRQDLLTIRRASNQEALMLKPTLAFDLLAYHLHFKATAGGSFMLDASFGNQNVTPGVGDGFHLPKALEPVDQERDYNLRISAEGFGAFLKSHDEADRMKIVCDAIARSYSGTALPDLVEERTATSPRMIWTPTAKGYFARVPESTLDAIFVELIEPEADDETFAAFARQKKKDKVRDLDALFNGHELREAWGLSRDTGKRIDAWLPPEMRGA